MYSLVLMAALTTAPDVPEFGGLFRNTFGGSSCGGACYGSCSGACYGTCAGRAQSCYGTCSGCGGCGGHFFGNRFRVFSARNSCQGSCVGASSTCYGCCGGGCCGGMAMAMPMAPMYSMPDCPECGTGVPYGIPAPGYDAAPFTGAPITLPGGPLPTAPGIDAAPAIPRPAVPPPPTEIDTQSRAGAPIARTTAGQSGRATVTVRLPADAKLFADGRELTLTSSERTFVTPVLPPGQGFTYTFRVEYDRDGETISQSKRVQVIAGGSASVEFVDLTTARRNPTSRGDAITRATSEPRPADLGLGLIAPTIPPPAEPLAPAPAFGTPPLAKPDSAPTVGDRARITVKLPPGSTLYVDDKKSEKVDPVREFATPPLPPGQEFAYLMKAEHMRDGRPEYQIQKVTFRAGEILTVDFTAGDLQ